MTIPVLLIITIMTMVTDYIIYRNYGKYSLYVSINISYLKYSSNYKIFVCSSK